jgi:putative two-component system response regulator
MKTEDRPEPIYEKEAVRPTPDNGPETISLLFVDDEKNVLSALERAFMDSGMSVKTAADAFEAIDILRNSRISVIVSDNMMPGMTGIEFLRRAKEISPDTVRIMMTAYADVRSAIDAINKGEVYRFVTKPWDEEELREIIGNAARKYRVVQSLRDADEARLLSLAQTIELKDPYTRGHCERVARYALLIADSLGLGAEMKKDIRYGSWLHDCGKIGVPEAVLNYPGRLSEKEMEIVRSHPVWGADVARQARLSERIINIVLYHHERFDGLGYPSGLKAADIPYEARIVAVCDTFDAITSDRPYQKRHGRDEALGILRSLEGKSHDPELVSAFVSTMRDDAGQADERGESSG